MNNNRVPTKITCAIIGLTCLFFYVSCNTEAPSYDHTTWSQYGAGPDQSKYFDADEITRQNVNQMQVAWTYPTEDNIPYMFQPIVVDTMMYVYGKNFSLIALSIITGKEIWIHTNLQGLTRRGVNYWESKNGKDKRLVFTLSNSLQEIDAMTGKSIMSFGDSGYVDMRVGLDRDPTSIRRMQAMTPGVIYDDLIIKQLKLQISRLRIFFASFSSTERTQSAGPIPVSKDFSRLPIYFLFTSLSFLELTLGFYLYS